MRSCRNVIALLLALAVATRIRETRVDAQDRRPLTLVDLAEMPRLLDPQLSPDGRFVAYTLARADWKANRLVGQIWRQAVTGGRPEQLTRLETGVAPSVRWSPDGKSMLFLANVGEAGIQVHRLPADGGEAKQLTRHATGVSQAAWAPDGSSIYFVASDARTTAERERDRLRDDVYAFDEDFKQRHLWKVSVADGEEEKVTDGDWSVLAYRLSRDGRQIVVHRAPTPLVERQRAERNLDRGCRRWKRPGAHRQRRRRERGRAFAGRYAAAISRRGERAAGAVPRLEAVPGSRSWRQAHGPAAELSVRDRASGLATRRPRDSRRGQHGRPQRDLQHRSRRRDERGRLPTGAHRCSSGASCRRPAGWSSSSTSPCGSATPGRCRLKADTLTRVTWGLRWARGWTSSPAAGEGRVEGRRRGHRRRAALLSDWLPELAGATPLVVQLHGGPHGVRQVRLRAGCHHEPCAGA